MTINLEKRLVANKRKGFSVEEQMAIDQMHMLKSTVGDAGLSVLARIGVGNDTNQKAKRLIERTSHLNKFPSDRVFSKEDIKDLCIKYGLRFLPSSKFQGEICPKLVGKIEEFEKKFDFRLNYKNSFICAPASSFKLEPRPKDPLFFVEIDNDKYYLLHKWGKDISVLRWFTNIFKRNTTMVVMYTLVLPSLLGGMLGTYFHRGSHNGDLTLHSFFVFAVITPLLGMLARAFYALFSAILNDKYIGPLPESNASKWNSEYE